MKPNRITFTGADDSVAPQELYRISLEFPMTEWGILFSVTGQGNYRFPTVQWLHGLQEVALRAMMDKRPLNLSAHLCGAWVRKLVLQGDFKWAREWGFIAGLFQRVQINFHGEFHRSCLEFRDLLGTVKDFDYIFQCDGVNDSTAKIYAVQGLGFPLFDTSGGAGIVPRDWPDRWPNIYCGYAGGLGPENIREELARIEQASPDQPYWIDMERRVRSTDDSKFEIDKVLSVLEAVQ